MNTIDLRSDTVTRPSAEMLKAMTTAKVGDDVFKEDPTVKALEELLADRFSQEEGLFCPSGTMTNQIAIQVHCQPGDEVICDQLAHIYLYEGGGIARNAGASVKLLRGDRGRISADEILSAINPDEIHAARTRLISIEDTCNKGGGSCYNFQSVVEISNLAKNKDLPLHLDGARVFNTVVKNNYDTKIYGSLFDSISICLSKGLGAPVGSVLLGKKDFIEKARRVRKVMGGGMRQAGFLAAAGIFALQNNISRLAEDHENASVLEGYLKESALFEEVIPVETNIVIGIIHPKFTAQQVLKMLQERNILAAPFGPGMIRFVTHLDVSGETVIKAGETIAGLKP